MAIDRQPDLPQTFCLAILFGNRDDAAAQSGALPGFIDIQFAYMQRSVGSVGQPGKIACRPEIAEQQKILVTRYDLLAYGCWTLKTIQHIFDLPVPDYRHIMISPNIAGKPADGFDRSRFRYPPDIQTHDLGMPFAYVIDSLHKLLLV